MMLCEDVWMGKLYSVDNNDEHPLPEELLTPLSVMRERGMIQVRWLWLTGPDAGTTFQGQPLSFNQQISVTFVV